jgi:hypothetical protein
MNGFIAESPGMIEFLNYKNSTTINNRKRKRAYDRSLL